MRHGEGFAQASRGEVCQGKWLLTQKCEQTWGCRRAGPVKGLLSAYDRKRTLPLPYDGWKWGWTRSAETWSASLPPFTLAVLVVSRHCPTSTILLVSANWLALHLPCHFFRQTGCTPAVKFASTNCLYIFCVIRLCKLPLRSMCCLPPQIGPPFPTFLLSANWLNCCSLHARLCYSLHSRPENVNPGCSA